MFVLVILLALHTNGNTEVKSNTEMYNTVQECEAAAELVMKDENVMAECFELKEKS